MTTKQITGFNLIEFLQLAQQAIVEGYRFDFENNDGVPQKFGNLYEAKMLLQEQQKPLDELQPVLEHKVEDAEPVVLDQNATEKQQPEVTRKKKVAQT